LAQDLVAQLLLAQISFDMPVAPRHNLEIFSQSALGLPEDMSILATGFPMDHKEIGYNRKTKIICTMGPSCWEVDMLCKLMEAGMNCARLNFSHGSHEAHGACVERLHEAMQRMPDKHVGILLDTKGPEIRTGFFKEECGGKIELKQGQDLKLVTDYDYKGDSTCFAITYQALPTSVKPGNQILMADGSVVLEVKQCNPNDSPPSVDCIVMNNAKIGERKNMNLPGVHVDLPGVLRAVVVSIVVRVDGLRLQASDRVELLDRRRAEARQRTEHGTLDLCHLRVLHRINERVLRLGGVVLELLRRVLLTERGNLVEVHLQIVRHLLSQLILRGRISAKEVPRQHSNQKGECAHRQYSTVRC